MQVWIVIALAACEGTFGVVPSTSRATIDTDAAPAPDPDTDTAPDTAPDSGTAPAPDPDTDTAPDTAPDSGTAPAPDTEPDPDPDPDPDPTDGLGECTGTPAECEAARVVNEYRARHVHAGECNEPLRWDANLGRLAHEHQTGPFVEHTRHGYVEVTGQAYGVRETAEYIAQWEAVIEEHCGPDGSYTVSHHCATMYCRNRTIGVGVYEGGGATYMMIMFGGEHGEPAW